MKRGISVKRILPSHIFMVANALTRGKTEFAAHTLGQQLL